MTDIDLSKCSDAEIVEFLTSKKHGPKYSFTSYGAPFIPKDDAAFMQALFIEASNRLGVKEAIK